VTVTALAIRPGGQPVERSWEEMLLDAVLPEFQVDVYHAVPGDPVLHGPTCAVGGCPGRGVNRSLGLNAGGENRSTGTRFRGYVCLTHVEMWRRDGEPPINVWVRQTARALKGQARPDRCLSPEAATAAPNPSPPRPSDATSSALWVASVQPDAGFWNTSTAPAFALPATECPGAPTAIVSGETATVAPNRSLAAPSLVVSSAC
jgi:hypothetical protein